MAMPLNRPAGAAPPIVKRERRMTLGAVSTGIVRAPLKLLVYGVPGVGKTELASQAPTPIFLPTEDGSAQLDVARLPKAESWDDILEAVEELTAAEHSYATLVVDTITGAEPLLFAKICKQNSWSNIEEPGFGKGEKAALPLWRELLSRLEKLQTKRGMHVVLIGHSSVKAFSDPDPMVGRYDRYNLNVAANKDADATALLCSWCDVVAFAAFDVSKRSIKDKQAWSSGERWLHFQRSSAFEAKTRFDHTPRLPLRRGTGWADLWEPIEPADLGALKTSAGRLLVQVVDPEVRGVAQGAVQDAAMKKDGKELRRIVAKLEQIVSDQSSTTDAPLAHQESK